MKLTNFILCVIAGALVILAVRLADLQIMLGVFNENLGLMRKSNYEIIEVNRQLADNLTDLKGQMEEINKIFSGK